MITIKITDGPTLQASWTNGMNVQQAMEKAYNAQSGKFTYSLQYFGSSLGYLVSMINETYESFYFKEGPFFFWEFLVNGTVATHGIDNTTLNDGDVVTFEFIVYSQSTNAASTTHAKYNLLQNLS
ncbi:hypothetical protein D3C71_971730 [compost metagenome]